MKPGDCPTPGCTGTQACGGADYDHIGAIRYWCARHGGELLGVRRRIAALLVQIEGMRRLLGVLDDNSLCVALVETLTAQGVLLIQLIRRERELTGAAGTSTD
jgi:hypothetical protein